MPQFNDPNSLIPSNYTNPNDWENPYTYFQDPSTGNIYSSNDENARLLASGEALNNPYIQSLGIGQNNLEAAQSLNDLKQTDPNAYYGQIAKQLNDKIYENWRINDQGLNAPLQKQLETIKELNPTAYYGAKIEDLGRQMGWQIGQNRAERNESTQKELQALIPEAIKAGMTPDQINQIAGTALNEANIFNQQRIINEQQSGNYWNQNLMGALKVGALAAGAYGLDAALAAGAAGSGALDSTAIALGGNGGGGAFVPTAGSSFAIAPGAAYGVGGSYLTPELMGPTYGELGYTGLEAGQMGPTYQELGYTGLNQADAIAQADAASQLAQLKEYAGNAKDVYSNASRAKKIADALTGGKSQQLGINPSLLASALTTPQAQFGGLYRMNEKPFLSTQQTASLSPDAYNVSGQNITSPTAPTNQLLANLLYPKA